MYMYMLYSFMYVFIYVRVCIYVCINEKMDIMYIDICIYARMIAHAANLDPRQVCSPPLKKFSIVSIIWVRG